MNRFANSPVSSLHCEKGAALVEFVLVIPIFLVLLLGIFDFSKAFNYWIDGTHLSHEGVRYAAVGKNPGPGTSLAESIRARADTSELQNGGSSVVGPIKVCVDFPTGIRRVGEPVEVTVEFTYQFLDYLTNVYPDITSKTVVNTSTMRLERNPPFTAHCTA